MKKEEKKNKKLSGFYIALCCCVLMIGIAGYVTEKHTDEAKTVVNTNPYKMDEAKDVYSNELDKDISLSLAAITPSPAPTPEVIEAPAEETEAKVDEVIDYTVDNPDVTDDAIMVSNELPAFIMPLNGDILEPFTDKLTFNNILSDWRAHGGIDIAAEKGCSVATVAQGEVEKIYDNVMGCCVEISHPAGFTTKYMGLENVENLSVGKEVKSGEVIGTTGDCRGENASQPHLHFEMYKDGVAVNPSDFLPH